VFENLFTPENLIALLTLTSLEIVLGIDNLVVIAILSGNLEPEKRPMARRLGLLAAMGMRILLLLSIVWIMRLTAPLFTVWGHTFSGKDLILIAGGLFLIAKSTHEIHEKIEHIPDLSKDAGKRLVTLRAVVLQIMIFDIIFSLDSVITAVGMAESIVVMITAIIIAIVIMIIFANTVSDFVERNPTIKILALSFLILIGVMLTAEGLGRHIEKGYIYFAMAFSLVVELLNMRVRRNLGKPEPTPQTP
jgi:predicted tellurium resistance membrane protein TerC